MYHSDLSRRIAQEQREKMVSAVESAAVTLFGVVTAALLPQLLYQYLLSGSELLEPPAFVQYIPHAGYGIAALVFLNMVARNYLRSRRIKLYTQELQMMSYMDCEGCDECLTKETEASADTAPLAQALAKTEKTKKRARKSVAKKATSKKAAKKTA